jgi:hypothetical protein
MKKPILTSFAGALLALAAPPVVASEPAQTAEQSELQALPAGAHRFVFTDWQGPALPVWTYRPEGIDPATAPIVIVMHGARRDADRYRDQWIKPAKAGGFIVVAPEFARTDFPKSRDYNLGGVFEARSTRKRDEVQWSFSAIEPLFDLVVARLGSSQTRYSIYGHSAGSQFVHRFLFFKPEARVKRYLAANAGWYTFADPDIAFPFGLGDTGVSEETLKAALAKDVVILLGNKDTDPDGRSLNKSDGAMKQGRHRFARGKAFFAAAQSYAESKGWDFGWSKRTVKGVAHSNGGMAPAAASYVE